MSRTAREFRRPYMLVRAKRQIKSVFYSCTPCNRPSAISNRTFSPGVDSLHFDPALTL